MAVLGKLLKYDLRANLKIYLFIWPSLILLALIDRLSLILDIEGMLGTFFIMMTTSLFVLALIAACIISVVISIVRFYSGLLRREGYLMFTLPVKAWQLVLSKFLIALLTVAVTVGLSIVLAIFVFSGVEGLLETLSAMLSAGDIPTGISLVLTILICIVSLCVTILQIYLACCIGHLFRRMRILFTILFYYAIDITVEAAALIAAIGIVGVGVIDNMMIGGSENLLLVIILLLEVGLSCVYYFFSERILRKHLNLE